MVNSRYDMSNVTLILHRFKKNWQLGEAYFDNWDWGQKYHFLKKFFSLPYSNFEFMNK